MDWNEWLRKNAGNQADSPEDFDLHLATVEWTLATPLDINGVEDLRSLPGINVEPFAHQVDNAIQFFRCLHPRGLLADDVGLGKTISAGLIARELFDRGKVESLLVVCPKPLMEQWRGELDSKFHLKATVASGSEFDGLEERRVWITTYHTASLHMARIEKRGFDMLIVDEAHTFRNLCGTAQPPKMAQRFQSLMRKDGVKYCLMLTATPIQNRLWDIFSQFEVLRAPHPNPLGTEASFKQNFIQDRDARQMKSGMSTEFRQRVSQALVRTRRQDAKLNFARREVRDSMLQPLPGEREYIQDALEAILELPNLLQVNYARGLMSSPHSLAESLRKMIAKGGLETGRLRTFEQLVARGLAFRETAKSRAVLEHVKKSAKKGVAGRLIVFTMRLPTLTFLHNVLTEAGFGEQIGVIQGGQETQTRRAIQDFMSEPATRPILLSTDTGAVGLNLQAGNTLINFDLPWNPMTIEQRIGRVQRLGQKAEHVVIHNLVLSGTIEERIVHRLIERLQLFNQALGEMEELLEMCGFDDDDRSLEQIIMDLIRKATRNRDIDEDLRRMEQSRKEAQARMAEFREATEKALGSIRAADRGARLQGLQRVQPRMSPREIIGRCLDQARVPYREVPGNRLAVSVNNRPVEFTFELADRANPPFSNPRAEVRLATPGSPAFERLTERIRNGSQLLVLDGTNQGLDLVARRLQEHLDSLGLVLEGIQEDKRQTCSAFWLAARASARVATDRYETMLEAPVHDPEDGVEGFAEPQALAERVRTFPLPPATPEQVRKLPLKDLQEDLERRADSDFSIRAFVHFYRDRYEEELRRLAGHVDLVHPGRFSGSDSDRVQAAARIDPSIRTALESLKIRFEPRVDTEPVGVCGLLYDRASIQVQVRNRHQGQAHPLRLEVVPISGALRTPLPVEGRTLADLKEAWACPGGHLAEGADMCQCATEECGQVECPACAGRESSTLSRCSVCESLHCRQHRAVCADCRRVLCLDHARRHSDTREVLCPEHGVELGDGRWVRRIEAGVSSLSGRSGWSGDLKASDLSGRLAFSDEMEQCQETGAWLFPDEVGVCSHTGHRVRRDWLEPEAVSGEPVFRPYLTRSQVSGRYGLPEHCFQSPRSQRVGLLDETDHCAVTGEQVLADELVECPETHQRALEDRFDLCDLTGVRILPQGLGTCQVSGRRVARHLLAVCADTGKTVLASLLSTCQETGAAVLPEALQACAVTGRIVRRKLLEPCGETGALALPNALETCAVSKLRVLPELLFTCPETGLRLLPCLAFPCAESGDLVAPDGLATCAETDHQVRRSLLVQDDLDGDLVLERLMGRCDKTGVRTRQARLATCEVTGRRVQGHLLAACQKTGRKALPEALVTCSVTGLAVHPDLVVRCAQTGAVLLRDRAVACEVTGALCAPTEVALCEATGEVVRSSLLAVDEDTGMRVQATLLARCEVTGRLTQASRLGRSFVSGRRVLADLLVPCEVSGSQALPVELVQCSFTGKRVLPSLVDPCSVTGQPVLRTHLSVSAVSGRRVRQDLLKKCEETGGLALEEELGVCQRTGKKVQRQLLGRCEVTNRDVLRKELVRCQESRTLAEPEHLDCCELTGKRVLKSLLSRSEVSGRLGLLSLQSTCPLTGLKAFHQELAELSSGQRVVPARVYACPCCQDWIDGESRVTCPVCLQEMCPRHLQGEACSYCRALFGGSGIPLVSRHLAALANHLPGTRSGRYLAHGERFYVLADAGIKYLGGRTHLQVYEGKGPDVGLAMKNPPLTSRTVT